MYLELHRATLTSQAKTKQGNRRSEHLLREAELWAATAAVRAGFPYPYEDLDRIWKTVLLHQFHDILPGSSIAWVHREARRTYERIASELNAIIDAAQRALAGEGTTSLLFNSAPHTREGVPAGGARTPAVQGETALATRVGGGHVLENGLLRVEVDGRGLVVSAYDIEADRETVAPGRAANLLQLHPDFPNMWDAWDVDEFYRNTVTDLTDAEEVVADGNAVRIVRSFGASRVTQVLSLAPGERRLLIDTEVDWHETEKFLKLAFPLDVHAERYASETQFGHFHRPTHTNTSWEAAKFEACNHRFVHMEEPGWGVAVVNDSTYGHDVTRTVRGDGDNGTTTTVRALPPPRPALPGPRDRPGRPPLPARTGARRGHRRRGPRGLADQPAGAAGRGWAGGRAAGGRRPGRGRRHGGEARRRRERGRRGPLPRGARGTGQSDTDGGLRVRRGGSRTTCWSGRWPTRPHPGGTGTVSNWPCGPSS